MIEFYDSAVLGDIPKDATYLAAYHDGVYAVTSGQIARTLPLVHHVRWITIENDFHSGIADFEPRNPVYDNVGTLRRWALGRHSLQMSTPIVYCDRADASKAVAQLDGLKAYYWIATLDGRDWTADELSANMAAGDPGPDGEPTITPVTIAPSRIWANQNINSNDPVYDRSNLFLGWWA